MWYSLDKKNKSKRRGLIKLRLAFSTEHNSQVAFQEHRHLLRLLLLHELENRKIERHTWLGSWSAPGEVVVLQHAVQRGMTPEQINLARWIEFATVHQEHQLSFQLFLQLANDLAGPLKTGSGGFNDDETRLFWEAAKKVIHSGLNMLRKIRRLQVDKENTMKQLVAILRYENGRESVVIFFSHSFLGSEVVRACKGRSMTVSSSLAGDRSYSSSFFFLFNL